MFCEAMTAIMPNAVCINKQDGAEGMRYLQSSPRLPDFIFLDVHMPVMGGVEVLKKIKADERLKNIPIVMYTSDNDPRWAATNVKRYLDLGAVDFIPKGLTFQEIVTRLKAFFR